jgi:hypothetical protein
VHPRADKIAFVSYRYHRPVPQGVAFSVGLDDPSVCRLCDQSKGGLDAATRVTTH